MNNPLLEKNELPRFSQYKAEHIEPAIKHVLSENRHTLKKLLTQAKTYTWESLIVPLEEISDKLQKVWAPISHLNAVKNSDDWRKAYNNCLPLLSDYSTELGQNIELFKAIQSITENTHYEALDYAQKKVLSNDVRNFHLSGVDLPKDQKEKFADIDKALSSLAAKFSENVLDATNTFTKHITDEKEIEGLPEIAVESAAALAKQKNLAGWVFTLEFPSYHPIMQYAANRSLREEMYKAYVTRASEIGPSGGQWDNSAIMQEILQKKLDQAQLLNFKNYAEYALAHNKMAKSPEEVLTFLIDLVKKVKSIAEKEIKEVFTLAKQDGIEHCEAWDIAYYSEKLRLQKYAISQEELRPYFPHDKVIAGMFALVKDLFGMTITEESNIDVWHEEVRYYVITDPNHEIRGSFYLDLFSRPEKRGGAWMDDCQGRRRLNNGNIQKPIAFLTCNFTRPVANKASLLTHDEVSTLFHEFGHGLQHMLTQINYADVAGINGVPWDAVEFPSQFMELWCWRKDILQTISSHVETGEPLPEALYKKMIQAKNFQSGLFLLRQLEFALFDFRLHLEYQPHLNIQQLLIEIRKEVSVFPAPEFNRFQHSFSHIFAGGYAAGYYSYLWAEVLSCDAFEKFIEQGGIDFSTGQKFLHTILEQGGAKDPKDLFIEFRGREPKIDAFLSDHGITQGI